VLRLPRAHALLTILALAALASSAHAQDDEIEIEIEADDPSSATPTSPPRDPAPTGAAAPTDPSWSAASSSAPSSAAASSSSASASSSSASSPSSSTDRASLEERLAALEAIAEAREAALRTAEERATRLEARLDALTDVPDARDTRSGVEENIAPPAGSRWWEHLRLSGYAQVEYHRDQLSRDELFPDGETRNLDRFLVRRGRLRLRGDWDWFRVALEIDASTVRGIGVSVRRAQLTALYRGDASEPLVALTLGLTTQPFGRELRIGSDRFPFMERSTGSLALFPGPTDAGARVHGQVGGIVYDVGVFNGTPVDDESGALTREPTRAPDVIARVGAEGLLADDAVELEGGVSFLYGTGFHPGDEGDKNHVEWVDLNENGFVDTGELVPVPARGATPSRTFRRWALGVDLAGGLRTKLGWTRLFGEVTIASNLDRGFFVADPIENGADLRELAAYVVLVQDVTPYVRVGYRFDLYDPDFDRLDNRRGALLPVDASVQTHSPNVTARWPGVGLLALQYDRVRDTLGRDVRGVPTDVKNDRWTLRVQGSF
jgi:hypothetical protein